MIPINRDPKRFVASLIKERRFRALTTFNRPIFGSKTDKIPRNFTPFRLSFSTETKHSFRREVESYAVKYYPGNKAPSEISESKASKETWHGPRPEIWYTGKAPLYGVCPGVASDGKIYSLPQLKVDKTCTKQALRDYFDNTWTLTEVLLASLQGEEAFMRSPYHNLRHPMIFYYGHPAAVYVNKLRVAGVLKDPINPYYESLFETGVDEMSWDDLSKNEMKWPSVSEVLDYRKTVYSAIVNIIDKLSDADCQNIDQKNPLWGLLMGFEHERIHIETSSVLINELPLQFVRFPETLPPYHSSVPKQGSKSSNPVLGTDFPVNEMVEVTSQVVKIGKPRDFPSFGWDNEYGYREFHVPAFKASKFKISNGEFWEFVKEGGYAKPEYWTEVGWKWRAFRNVKWPTFWLRVGPQGYHQYELRLLFDLVPMPWNWPVVVNYHEAVAFAKWKSLQTGKSYRIMTELEHRAIREDTKEFGKSEDDFILKFSGNEMPHSQGFNNNLAFSSMTPVDLFPPNKKGFHDVFGNAWDWMEDYFCPLPGFQIHPCYEDFSTPCFDGLHNVIQGGSFISTGNEASIHSRFHFRPHFYQHASFRLVEQLEGDEMITSDTDAPGPYVGSYPFRKSISKRLESGTTNQSIDSHFQTPNYSLLKHFAPLPSTLQSFSWHSISNTIINSANEQFNGDLATKRLLEVGCGPGGLTLQFASRFGSVLGIDHDNNLLTLAKEILQGNGASYLLKGEGEIISQNTVSLKENSVIKKVEYRCADPMCLPAELNNFDVVVLNDVIDKLASPNSLLSRMSGFRSVITPNGLLFVLSTFQWDESRTPKSLWLGGQPGSSAVLMLTEKLPGFKLINNVQIPVLWPSTTSDIHGKTFTLSVFKKV